MPFPSSGSSRESLSTALARLRATAHGVKQSAQDLRNASAAGNIVARRIVQVMEELTAANERFKTLKTVPGLAEYAKEQFADQGLDIMAEFGAMQSAVVACVTWIQTNMPKDSVSKRWIHVEELVDGKRVDRLLDPASMAGLRTVLDALIATID